MSSRRLLVGLTVAAVASLAALPVASPAQLPVDGVAGACAATLEEAASLVATDATVRSGPPVAGLRTAVVVDPMIPPGIPNAVLSAGDGWCGPDAFNLLARTALPRADAATLAGAFASVAGMNYLGEVTVREIAVRGDTVSLTTAGGRHGAVSDWTVTVDELGIADARFTTTGWEVDAADVTAGGLEGVTSLPGHTRTWTRDDAGLLRIDATIADHLAASIASRDEDAARAAAIVGNGPGDLLEHTGADGFRIILSYGMSPATPDTGTDTGVAQADRLRNLHRGIVRNYTQFETLGVVDPFDNNGRTVAGIDPSRSINLAGVPAPAIPEDAGYVNIDSPLAPYCLACAFLSDSMEIHMALLFPDVAPEVVGASYPDREAFFNDVLFHEMVHSLQGGYSDGRGGAYTTAFTEATARAAEALTDTATNTHQRGSIAYIDNANGCEGFENGRGNWKQAQAAGPFGDGHMYDSCYFFWTYYAEYGGEGLVALLETLNPVLDGRDGANAVELNLRTLHAAHPHGDGLEELARWGGAFATGAGYGIVDANGQRLDWFDLLRPAKRADDTSVDREVSVTNGGVMAFVVASDGTVELLPEGAAAYVATVLDHAVDVAPLAVGDAVSAGQVISIVAPGTDTYTGTLRVG